MANFIVRAVKFFFTLVLILTGSLKSSAQWGDAYHAPNNYLIQKQQTDYGNKMRNQIRSNTNTKSTYGSGSGTNQAALELERNWKANWAAVNTRKLTPSEIEAKRVDEENRAKNKKAYEAKLAQIYFNERQHTTKFDNLCSPYINTFITAGFNNLEANRMTRRHIIDYYTLTKKTNADNVINLVSVKNTYKGTAEKMSFEEIKKTLDVLYFYAPFTALQIVGETRKRFPEKEAELDNLELNCLEGYYASDFPNDNTYIADKYFTLLDKYPDIPYTFLKNIYTTNKNARDPYTTRIFDLGSKKNWDEQKKYVALRADHLSGITNFTEKRKKTKMVKEMMAMHNLSLADIIFMDQPSYFKDEYALAYSKQEKIFDIDRYSEYRLLCQKGMYEDLLEDMADAGDEDAIKMYAISLSNGWGDKQKKTKEKMFKNILKWSDKGYYPALVMSFRVVTREMQSGQLPFAKEAVANAKKNEHLFSAEQLQSLGTLLAATDTHLWMGKYWDLERDEIVPIKNYGKELLKGK